MECDKHKHRRCKCMQRDRNIYHVQHFEWMSRSSLLIPVVQCSLFNKRSSRFHVCMFISKTNISIVGGWRLVNPSPWKDVQNARFPNGRRWNRRVSSTVHLPFTTHMYILADVFCLLHSTYCIRQSTLPSIRIL